MKKISIIAFVIVTAFFVVGCRPAATLPPSDNQNAPAQNVNINTNADITNGDVSANVNTNDSNVNESDDGQTPNICKDTCGNNVCEEIVCLAVGCPCAESQESCPQDCA